MKSIFSINDRVTSKQTGLPAVGDVTAIMRSDFALYAFLKHVPELWNDLYPSWMDKPVICVKFDEPQKHMTFKEYLAAYSDLNKTEEWYKTHYEDIPKTWCAIYPEDDLELL